jgi:hypothetical protein
MFIFQFVINTNINLHIKKDSTFRSYSELLDLRMLLWLIIWNFLMTLISTTLILSKQCMIRRLIFLSRS